MDRRFPRANRPLAVQRQPVCTHLNDLHGSGLNLSDINRLLTGGAKVQIRGKQSFDFDGPVDRAVGVQNRDGPLAEYRDIELAVSAELHAIRPANSRRALRVHYIAERLTTTDDGAVVVAIAMDHAGERFRHVEISIRPECDAVGKADTAV